MIKALLRHLPHPLISASFITAFAFYIIYGQPVFDDPDMPWHIAAGDWILAHHAIPKYDPFSYTAGNTPWYNISWLWDIALSGAVAVGGINGAQFLGVLVIALSLALLCYVLQRRGIAEDPIKVTLFLTGLVLSISSLARPQVAGYALIVIFHFLLHNTRESRSKSTLFLLPALMVLWVNLHGSFLVGFTLIGAYGIEALYHKDRKWFIYLLAVGIFTSLAIFINPYGIGIITATLRTLDSVMTSYIREWHPFTYGTMLPTTLYILTIFMVSNPRNKDIPLADKILTFCWLLMAFNSIRNFTVLAFVAAPYMALNIQKAMVLHNHPDISALKYRVRMAGFAIVVAVMLLIPSTQHFLRKDTPSNVVPTEEIAFIQQHYPDIRFMNDYNIGGYLIYYMHSPGKIFVDGRAGTAYSEAVLTDFLTFFTLKPEMGEIFDRYNIGGIIVNKSHRFAKYYERSHPPEWKKTLTGKVANVYIRQPQGK